MTGEQVVAWLEGPESQRAKLAALRAHVPAIRTFSDGDFQAVVRAIKKRLGSPKLAAEVAALLAELTHDRVLAPVRATNVEAPPVPWVGTTDDAQRTALEAVIAADPDAQGPYIVLGDTLGDPWSELVTVGHALVKNPTHKAMRARWDRLLETHRTRILGGSYPIKDADWYMGFVRACTLWTSGLAKTTTEILHALLDDPGPGRFVQRLTIAGNTDRTFEPAARVIAARPRPTLRMLKLVDAYPLGDISPLWPAVEYLRELRLEGSAPSFGEPRAPRLERFAIEFGREPDGQLAALAPLLAAQLPALRTLALTNCSSGDALCAALVASPLLSQLVDIDLSSGTIGREGADVLVANRDKLAHVQRLYLELNFVPDGHELARLPGVELGQQRIDDGYRYPAAYE